MDAPAERDGCDSLVEVAAAAKKRSACTDGGGEDDDGGRDVPGRAPHPITMPPVADPKRNLHLPGVPSRQCSVS
jgi:hypothetical protein